MAIKLEDKTNVEAPSADYPYGKILDDTGIGDGTPVDVQVYGDFHQFMARMLALSGLAINNLPDNNTNGFQYYEAFEALVSGGLPGASGGTWINGGTPTLTCDTGSVSQFSTGYNRYKIIGKTFIWQMLGALSVNSGTPSRVSVSYPASFTMPGFNTALPRKFMGFYKDNLQTMIEMQLSGVDMRIYPSANFSNTAQPYSFTVITEIV